MQNNTPDQRRKLGILFKILSYSIAIGGMLILGWWDSTQYEDGYSDSTIDRLLYALVFFSCFAFLFFLVVKFHRISRSLLQKSAEEAMKYDTRPHVLYLRPFQADSTMSTKGQALGLTEEEQWTYVLSEIGPVIALECPWESTKSPGAARLTAKESNWQQLVQDHLTAAQLTVIRVGSTEALKWEMEQAKELVKPEKLIFLLPSRREFNFEEFQKYARDRLEVTIPILGPESLRQRLGLRTPLVPKVTDYLSVERILLFDANWNPDLLNIPVNVLHFLRSPLKSGLTASIKYAMKPVFENLGIVWLVPSLKLGPILAFVIFFVATIMGALERL